jgi:hypothetical protein
MTVRMITTWPALFAHAGRLGEARVAYARCPTDETKAALDKAKKEHDEYRDLCLEAVDMIGIDFASAYKPTPPRPKE